MTEPAVVAVLGKGGAGKTAFSTLLSRVLVEEGRTPLLLVDADPTGGLVHALGVTPALTLADVGERLRQGAADRDADREELAGRVDWHLLEALEERDGYSVLAMGRTEAKGCFCPLSSLLRTAIEKLSRGFRVVLIDAEAGVEQVNRRVMRGVDLPVVISDGSRRSREVAATIAGMLEQGLPRARRAGLVVNRAEGLAGEVPRGLDLLGVVPEDPELREFDALGRSLLSLPADSPALAAVRKLATGLVPY